MDESPASGAGRPEITEEEMRVTFWLNMPSHHMAPVVTAFGKIWPDQVSAIFAHSISPRRKDLGWREPPLRGIDVHYLEGDLSRLDQALPSWSGLHLFGGFSDRVLSQGWRRLAQVPETSRGLILEASIPLGLKGRLRPFVHRIRALSTRRSCSMVLAIGSEGVKYFTRAGYDPKTVFPFIYQCDEAGHTSDPRAFDPVRLIYVGSFMPRKGVDILLGALEHHRARNWRLSIAGSGQGESEMKALARSLGIESKVTWLGTIESTEIPHIMAQHDVCVVPSRFDGWGMAVSEAIEVGLAVVCTPTVVAKDLVTHTGAGFVSESTSVDKVARCIGRMLDHPPSIETAKAASRAYRANFRGPAAAQYLSKILNYLDGKAAHVPGAPWTWPPGSH